jgi:intein-encoded DNA endonuclease-like protein
MQLRPKIKTEWSRKLAYAVGLITTDGNLSKDQRHMTFVSKDLVLVKTFSKCLGINNKISLKRGGFTNSQLSSFVQFTNVKFYNFLLSIGLMPAKSKILKQITIPNKYFFHFLRGHFDGDGTFYSYWDKRWKSSFMFYLSFASASLSHIVWLRKKINELSGLKGELKKLPYGGVYKLNYAKKEGAAIIKKMYANSTSLRLLAKIEKWTLKDKNWTFRY